MKLTKAKMVGFVDAVAGKLKDKYPTVVSRSLKMFVIDGEITVFPWSTQCVEAPRTRSSSEDLTLFNTVYLSKVLLKNFPEDATITVDKQDEVGVAMSILLEVSKHNQEVLKTLLLTKGGVVDTDDLLTAMS